MFRFIAALVVIALLPACSFFGGSTSRSTVRGYDQPGAKEEIRRACAEIDRDFRRAVRMSADKIADKLDDTERIQQIQRWEDQMLAHADEIEKMEPLRQLTGYWVFSGMMQDMLESRVGEESRTDPPRALRTVNALLDDIEDIAVSNLSAQELDALKKQVEQALKNEGLTPDGNQAGWGAYLVKTPANVLGRVANIGLSPIKSVASGAGGVVGLPQSVNQLVDVLDNYPEEWRQEVEIVLANDTVTSVTESLERFTVAMEEVSTSIKELPEKLGNTIRDVEATLPEFRTTMQQFEETVNATQKNIAETSKSLQDATKSLNQDIHPLLRELNEVLKQAADTSSAIADSGAKLGIGQYGPEQDTPESDQSEGESFNINEWTAALKQLDTTLVEVQNTADKLTEVTVQEKAINDALKQFNEGFAETTKQLENSTTGIIDYLIIRLAILAGVIFVLALIYKAIALTMQRKMLGKRDS